MHHKNSQKKIQTKRSIVDIDDSRTSSSHDLAATIESAITLHQKGQYSQAEDLYREILQQEPHNYQVLHRLATVLLIRMNCKEAVEMFERALKIDSSQPGVLNNYGLTLYDLKRFDDAIKSYNKAIDLNPDFVDAYYNRAHSLQQLKRYDEAIAGYGQVILLKPDFAEAYYYQGNALQRLKRYEDAVLSYNKAIAFKPDYAEAYLNRGLALYDLKRYEDAVISHDMAIVLNPDYAEAYSNRGLVLYEMEKFDDAVQSYDKAVLLKPDYAEAYSNRSLALICLKRFDDAIIGYDRVIAINPDFAKTYFHKGHILQGLKRHEDAVISYDKAIELNPDYAEAYFNRGNVFRELKKYEDAIQNYDLALARNPDGAGWFVELMHLKMFICDWSTYALHCDQLTVNIDRYKKASPPFAVLALIDLPSIHKEVAINHVAYTYPSSQVLSDIQKPERGDKIRIGYFSTDFRNHAMAHLIAELFELHDRSRFQIIAFSLGPDGHDDGMRKRVAAAFDRFIDVTDKSDKEVALLSRELRVDIAVDLNGFTAGCRTGIFAMRAAPIQVNYMGFPGTMGAEYIDYILADPTLIPESSKSYYTEKIAYLPNSYQVNDSKRRIAEKMFTREELGLPKTGFVFYCFNNNFKITPYTFDRWMRIIQQVEGSVLWLFENNQFIAGNLQKEAERRGISKERLIFAKFMPPPLHLARQRLADLFLDTLPYNGHTTASDALWAGVPVLTCIGESFASRVAASLLNAIHLPELITKRYDEYEALAIELATHPEKLHDIKNRLAKNRLTTPLFDIKLFTHHIEAAYTEMYERYQADLSPEHLYIKNIFENMGEKIPTLQSKVINITNVQQGNNIMSEEQQISIDNVNYPLSTLTDSAKALLSNLQFTDNEIARMNTLLAVTKTARATYAQALKAELQKTGTTQA